MLRGGPEGEVGVTHGCSMKRRVRGTYRCRHSLKVRVMEPLTPIASLGAGGCRPKAEVRGTHGCVVAP